MLHFSRSSPVPRLPKESIIMCISSPARIRGSLELEILQWLPTSLRSEASFFNTAFRASCKLTPSAYASDHTSHDLPLLLIFCPSLCQPSSWSGSYHKQMMLPVILSLPHPLTWIIPSLPLELSSNDPSSRSGPEPARLQQVPQLQAPRASSIHSFGH